MEAGDPMPRYVALLRGINLGPRNKIAMGRLRTACESVGYEDVATYIQSGNVVFSTDRTATGALERTIEHTIESTFDLRVAVLVRTAAEMRRTVKLNPFPEADSRSLHVTFLSARPLPSALKAHGARAADHDEFKVVGRDLYLHLPNGFGRSKLASTPVERTLEVTGTTRNWRTVTTLADMVSHG
jgi:uncharacterized protein (DUF1697 family)